MRSTWIVACAVVMTSLPPIPADAQSKAPPAAADARERARALANRGYTFFQAGQHAEALEVFREAEAEHHAPTLLLMIARTHDRLGQLLEARAAYQQILDEAIGPSDPGAFREAQQAAQAELPALARRIPAVQIRVNGAPADAVTLTLDGAPASAGDAPIPRNPGRVAVVVRVPGRSPAEQTLTLEEGRIERLTFSFEEGGASASPRHSALWPPVAAFGVAGVGLTVGTVTGIIAKLQIDDIESRCRPDGHCLRSDQPKADEAQRLSTVSAVSFVLGGVAAGAGVALLVLRPKEPAPAPQAGVRFVVGPGSAHLVGRF